MGSIDYEFRQYLSENFSNLHLKSPLFYNWPTGIRFDLQTSDPEGEGYFDEVVNRATSLFRYAFDSSDKIFLVLTDYRYRRRKIRFSNYVFKQLKQLTKGDIYYTKGKGYGEPGKRLASRNIAVIKLTVEQINYKNIFSAISNSDFGYRLPGLDNTGTLSSKEIYFLNITKKLIFYMYDNRGLDIIATDAETLRPIYERYSEWILAYHREQIAKLFLD